MEGGSDRLIEAADGSSTRPAITPCGTRVIAASSLAHGALMNSTLGAGTHPAAKLLWRPLAEAYGGELALLCCLALLGN